MKTMYKPVYLISYPMPGCDNLEICFVIFPQHVITLIVRTNLCVIFIQAYYKTYLSFIAILVLTL
jgi:hypothetical protein